jgi:hypothetical protein
MFTLSRKKPRIVSTSAAVKGSVTLGARRKHDVGLAVGLTVGNATPDL